MFVCAVGRSPESQINRRSRSWSRMEKILPMSREFPLESHRGGDPSNSHTSRVRASALGHPLILKTISYNICIMLIFATSCFGQISSQGNFSLESTSYQCSRNVICLGTAHEYTNESNSNGIQVGRLSLIQEGVTYTQGIAYYNESVRLLDLSKGQSASFNTRFVLDTVKGTNNGTSTFGDGMAFVISADNSTIGSSGKHFGIFNDGGVTTFKSIVVEFDSWYNPDALDISDNHVSFDFATVEYAAAANASDVNVRLGDERKLFAWVDYTSETHQLEVRISNINSRPVSPLLNYTVNLVNVVEEYMWVGFSSGSGDAYSSYYIGDWTFDWILGSSPAVPTGGQSGGNKLGIIVGCSVGIPTFLIACIVIALLVRRSGRRTCQLGWAFTENDPTMQLEGMPERFSYKQLSVATKAFSHESKLGQGGFGTVYRGVLPSSGIPVAVKGISSDSSQGEKEFMAEVSIISRLRHRNLIQLLGWCKDASKKKYLLVYELMPNGSLDKVLFGPTEKQTAILSWPQRFNIVAGTAAALHYLHQEWTQQVIHRDIKASNIMLDKEWNAKLGDFGLARLVDHQKEAATTLVAGTYGYIAPEVPATGRFTEKSDVFAFGAVVLEVACGRKALSTLLPEDEMILVDWVWRRLSEGDLMRTVDKRLEDYDSYWMEVMLMVGLLCSHPDPQARPSIRHVVQILAGDVPVPSVPTSKPAFVPSSNSHRVSLHGPRTWSHSTSWSSSKSRSAPISLVATNTSASSRGFTVESLTDTSSNGNS